MGHQDLSYSAALGVGCDVVTWAIIQLVRWVVAAAGSARIWPQMQKQMCAVWCCARDPLLSLYEP